MTGQQDTALATPPMAVTAATAFVSLPDLVLWLTAIYTALLIGHKAWKIYRDYKESRGPKYGRRATDRDDE